MGNVFGWMVIVLLEQLGRHIYKCSKFVPVLLGLDLITIPRLWCVTVCYSLQQVMECLNFSDSD